VGAFGSITHTVVNDQGELHLKELSVMSAGIMQSKSLKPQQGVYSMVFGASEQQLSEVSTGLDRTY
jgi:hypothetical protein